MSGISSMAMSEDADPRDPGVAMADAFAGYVAFSAIMVALLEREQATRRGRHVTVSMLEAALVLQTASVLSAHAGGERSRRRTNQGRFMAKDRRIYANLMFPKWYEAVCTIIGRPDLLEPPWADIPGTETRPVWSSWARSRSRSVPEPPGSGNASSPRRASRPVSCVRPRRSSGTSTSRRAACYSTRAIDTSPVKRTWCSISRSRIDGKRGIPLFGRSACAGRAQRADPLPRPRGDSSLTQT